MDQACFNCGQTGHYARDCTSRPRPSWKPIRLPADEQAAINEKGIALCRMTLAQRGK